MATASRPQSIIGKFVMVDLNHFPLAQPAPVTCGNRNDLPKKQRRHVWASMGKDVRNAGSAGFKEYLIGACVTCGRDEKFDIPEVGDSA